MSASAKRAEELAAGALASFKEELRPTIQRDLQMAFKNCAELIRKSVKDEIMHELKPILKAELKEVTSVFCTQLTDGTTKHVTTAINNELKPVLEKIDKISSHPFRASIKAGGDEVGVSPLRGFKGNVKGKQRRNGRSGTGDNIKRTITAGALAEVHSKLEAGGKLDEQAETGQAASAEAPISRGGNDERQSLIQEISVIDPIEEESRDVELIDTAETIILSETFEWAMTGIILANAIALGVSTDYAAQNLAEPPLAILEALDVVFFFIFLGELCLRLFVYKASFFFDEGYIANIFDFSLVVMQFVDEVTKLPFVAALPGGVNSLNNLRGLRLLRVIRLLRIVRLIRFVSEMRMIASSLAASMKSLLGAMFLLVMVLYLFGVFFTQMVVDERKGNPDLRDPTLDKLFGSLLTTMLTLYMNVTGGLDWAVANDQLSQLASPILNVLLVVYVAFCVFAMMNVITGVFVGQAMQSVQEDQDNFMVKNINGVFKKTEATSGQITWEEFSKLIHEREMIELFKAINIDVSEAMSLFRLLDSQGAGVLDYGEFMSGCLRLRGPAKSLELSLLMRETDRIHAWNSKKLTSIENRINTITSMLGCDVDEPGESKPQENDVVRLLSDDTLGPHVSSSEITA
eukprot:TRINITY_DN2570_c0_g2_i1.p1 TRINITY_DN2570_c0_g2~~TRINITY_DN2570_c0_g2_i1.p1  ORF type:complete len:632 (-),score=117.38 TRINITY_DN2570_c0_g2_i1:198-2093(-)